MKSFLEFLDDEEVVFANAGGNVGQYDKFKLPYVESIGFANAGGSPLEENLNPKNMKVQVVHQTDHIFVDPEKNNKGLGLESNTPENLGIENRHNKNYVVPHNTTEHAKNIKNLVPKKDNNYYDTTDSYTSNSYNLNRTLLEHDNKKITPPDKIPSNLDISKDDTEKNPQIHLSKLDNLIKNHKTLESVVVYSGLHFDPATSRGKIKRLPAYTSTSLNPHVAKDFGSEFHVRERNGDSYYVKHMMRLDLPKGQHHLLTDHGSHFPGQSEIILPRNTRLQMGREPTHIVQGNFSNHFNGKVNPHADKTVHYIWNARILKHKE